MPNEDSINNRMVASGSGPSDLYGLKRFVEAQQSSYSQALAELRAGKKRSHWSWYVLPQIRGLGQSPISVRYSISSLAEAKAYLEHPTLGARLLETVATLNAQDGLSAEQILGPVDAQKFRSCLTLFGKVGTERKEFRDALRKYFSGVEDPSTIAILARQASED
jgi:uncharacterized protein (DUF1810 family)